MGGYGKEHVSEVRTIYLSSTREDLIKQALSKVDAVPYEGQIIGAAGLLMIMAGELGMENLSLLIEAGDAVPDYLAAKSGVETLSKLLDLDLKVDDPYGISVAYERMVKSLES